MLPSPQHPTPHTHILYLIVVISCRHVFLMCLFCLPFSWQGPHRLEPRVDLWARAERGKANPIDPQLLSVNLDKSFDVHRRCPTPNCNEKYSEPMQVGSLVLNRFNKRSCFLEQFPFHKHNTKGISSAISISVTVPPLDTKAVYMKSPHSRHVIIKPQTHFSRILPHC